MEAVAGGRRMGAASGKASRAARRQIEILAPDVGPESLAAAVDAAIVAAEAFERLSKSDRNTKALARISRIVLLEGRKAAVTVNQRSLVITLVNDVESYAAE